MNMANTGKNGEIDHLTPD